MGTAQKPVTVDRLGLGVSFKIFGAGEGRVHVKRTRYLSVSYIKRMHPNVNVREISRRTQK
jgi:hypothetical protein